MRVKKNIPLLLAIFFSIVFFMQGCNNSPSSKKEAVKQEATTTLKKDTTIKGNFQNASGILFDSMEIERFLVNKTEFKEFSDDFFNFYRSMHFNYVWYNKEGLIEPAKTLVATIENQKEEGVFTKIPYEDEYLQIANYNDPENVSEDNKPDINKELMLTGQYFNYAKKVWSGSANGKAEGWFLPRKKLNYGELLESNVQKQAFEADVNNNVRSQYEGLKATLAQYRQLEKQGSDISFAVLKKPSFLKQGDSAEVIAAVRKKMNQLGLLNEDNQSHFFDAALAQAIILFKKTNGLKTDEVINNDMIKALNIPIKKRIEQILVNMERMRWIPSNIETDEFILVNIPAFTLSYYEGGKNVWGCNVVVGKPMNKTVIFTGKMQYVVFSPYWNVPPSIIKSEIKPGMSRNPKYLEAHNMEWNGGHVRQKPGPRNSLGLVKFLFPNANNIYLHDSPAKNLFNEGTRAFSHGCIRVEKPKELAMRILKQAPEWTEVKIDAAMHAGSERYVTLKKQIPVYIGYFTAFMDIDGHVNFRPDIYHRDPGLLSLIMQ